MQLDDVSVTIDGRPAYISYVSPTQLNVLAPAGTALGQVPVQTKSGGLASTPVMVDLQSTSPAFFRAAQYAVAVHGSSNALVQPTGPADAGETITLYGTGFGATNPPVPDGENITTALPLAGALSLSIGGLPAEVTFAGVVSPGLYQVNAKVPANVSTGDVAVTVQVNGARSPDGVLVSTREKAQLPDTPGPYSAEIDNFRFAPTSIDVGAGGELTWTNKQNVEHTVVSDDGKFRSGVLGVNDTFSTKLATPGTYPYHCSIHPFMKGTVVVK